MQGKQQVKRSCCKGLERAETCVRKFHELFQIHVKRLRRILDVALMEGNEVVILGAFGCGGFANHPEVVAKAAKEVLTEYRHAFKTVEFAVYCSPRDEENFRVFGTVMSEIRE